MPKYEDKPGSGTLWENERKQSDSHPDFRGKFITPGGETVYLSAWRKVGGSGKEFISLAFDQREADFQANKSGGGSRQPARQEARQETRGREYGGQGGGIGGGGRYDNRDDLRQGGAFKSSKTPTRQDFNADLDDEIPF